jgi:transcriptional regulator with XRE-family HTH domain
MGADAGVPEGFGRLLRGYRTAAGLTQEELAGRAGLSVRAVSDMERGRTARPFGRSVRLLADALGLPEPDRAELINVACGDPGEPSAPTGFGRLWSPCCRGSFRPA